MPSACAAAEKAPSWRPVLARAPALSYSYTLDNGRACRSNRKERGRGGNQLTSIFLFLHSEVSILTALWPKPAVQAGAPTLSDSYLLDERARARRIKAKEGGVIIFFSFFFQCVRVDVSRILTKSALRPKRPPARKGDVILPFPVLTAALPQDSILFECRFFSSS